MTFQINTKVQEDLAVREEVLSVIIPFEGLPSNLDIGSRVLLTFTDVLGDDSEDKVEAALISLTVSDDLHSVCMDYCDDYLVRGYEPSELEVYLLGKFGENVDTWVAAEVVVLKGEDE